MACGLILLAYNCSAVGDDDGRVAKRVVTTIHIVGFHVPPRIWLPLVLKPFGNIKTSQTHVSAYYKDIFNKSL